MIVTVTGSPPHSPLTEMWRAALEPLELVHPNRISIVTARLIDGGHPILCFGLDRIPDNDGPSRMKERFAICSTTLRFFPGIEGARVWMACAFGGYILHEAMELATVGGVRVADPHAEPYPFSPWNRSLREGFPSELTEESMMRTIRVVTG
jgi:hypothetical protein